MPGKNPLQGPEFSKDREFTAVLEDLRSQFRTFGDGLEGVNEKLDHLESDVSELKSEVFLIKTVVQSTQKELQTFNKRLTAVEAS